MGILLITSIIVIALAVVLLAIQIIAKPNGRFPNTHIGAQKPLQDKGIYCQRTQQAQDDAHKKLEERVDDN